MENEYPPVSHDRRSRIRTGVVSSEQSPLKLVRAGGVNTNSEDELGGDDCET